MVPQCLPFPMRINTVGAAALCNHGMARIDRRELLHEEVSESLIGLK